MVKEIDNGKSQRVLELNKTHIGDCMELSKDIPDNYVDLVVTSPPSNKRVPFDTSVVILTLVRDSPASTVANPKFADTIVKFVSSLTVKVMAAAVGGSSTAVTLKVIV